ncbi:MAG: DUF4160 domain-containing protein [Candidatus Hydrogenedentes bacterium]|nr:DUF4160 domain-containing protein [Candidatus Hydrogenedentota bacterium]
MPTVLRSGPYRFYFFSHEPNEPAHIHIDRDDKSAKFWLSPVSLSSNLGFSAHELREIRNRIETNASMRLRKWIEYFAT